MSRLHTLNESTSLCAAGSTTKECASCVWSVINSERTHSLCVRALHTHINKISSINRITSEALG